VGRSRFILIIVTGLLTFDEVCAEVKFSGVGGSLNFDQPNSSLALTTTINNFNGILKIAAGNGIGDNLISSAGNINFSDGVIQIGGNASSFTGAYVPGALNASDTILLNDNDVLEIFAGDTLEQVVMIASSATATISGSTLFASSITLTDTSSTLNLSLRHKLNQDINLNGGKLVLLDDLSLKDGLRFLGAGTVDLSSLSLQIGASSTAWDNSLLVFNNADEIQLNGNVNLTGTWSFQTATTNESVLSGRGNILDLSGGGKIQVAQNHTLYINDLHIKGFSSTSGFDIFNDPTLAAKIVLSKVTLELADNYLHSAGTIQVSGDLVRVISGGQYTFTVDGQYSQIYIDGVALYYETLGGTQTSPFLVNNSGKINTANGGVIRSTIAIAQPVDIVIDAATQTGIYTLNKHLSLTPTSKIVINNSADPRPARIIIDGSNCSWTVASSSSTIIIGNSTRVTLTNVILKNFTFSYDLGSNSELDFGDGVIIDFGNVTPIFQSSSTPLICSGNVTLRGPSNLFTTDVGGIVQRSKSNKTLTLENLLLKVTDPSGLRCSDYRSKIALNNSSLILTNTNGSQGLGFDVGSLDIYGQCTIIGGASDATDGTVNFDWLSTGTLTIKSGATLQLDHGVNFQYKPAILASDASWVNSKRHVQMEDPSATLFCNGCTITSTQTGLALDKGNLVINNQVIFNASTNDIESAELGSSLNVEILAASILDIDGSVLYDQTSI
jgi:hypothetical protein